MWRQKYAAQASPYAGFLLSRWWRIAPLFFAVHLLAAGLIAMGVAGGSQTLLNDPVWWLTQPAVAGSTQFGRLLPPAWSLDVEMQFYFLAPLLMAGMLTLKTRGLALLALGATAWGILRLLGPASLETPLLDVFLWLFVIGAVCDQAGWKPRRRTVAASIGLMASVLLAMLAIPTSRPLIWRHGASTAETVIGGEWLFLVLCLVSIPIAISTVHRSSGSWDRWLGDLSYPLYLFHWLPRDWYYRQVDWAQPAWWNGGLLLTNFAASILGAIVLLHLIDRPAQRARAAWFKSKQSRPMGIHTPQTENSSP